MIAVRIELAHVTRFSPFATLVLALSVPVASVRAQGNAPVDDQFAPVAAPVKPHPHLAIEKELLTEEESAEFERLKRVFTSAMIDGSIVGQNRAAVEKGLRILVLRLSLKSHRGKLAETRVEVERWIRRAGTKPGVAASAQRTFRTFVLDEVIVHARSLLDGNLHTRMQAMILLNAATVRPYDPIRKTPEEFYVPTSETFLEVLADREQHDAVRIWAARGLSRVLREGDAVRNAQRWEITQALVREIENEGNFEWLDVRMLEALGDTGIVRYAGGKPLGIETLSNVLVDPARGYRVRSEAAKQLGRIEVDPIANLPLFAHETGRLVQEMATAQARDPRSPHWRVCFLNAYLAFVPRDRSELVSNRAGHVVRGEGRHSKFINEALAQIAPLVDHVVSQPPGRPIPADRVAALDGWLKANAPPSRKPLPDLDPLPVSAE